MIYCITVTCHCNTVKPVKAHTNEYRFVERLLLLDVEMIRSQHYTGFIGENR